jgi:3'-phosphoadenosine 5'-phosphosulfate sulfotransferase (PAPS reductase)/FAD synthetase
MADFGSAPRSWGADDGQLPADVHVTFANTGKEREETLRFVHECESRWNVRIRWVEVAERPMGQEGRLTPAADRFQEVGYNSASRNGEPLLVVIRRKKFLPNPAMRFCTIEAKIRVMRDFMVSQGHKNWINAVGLRADEIRRIVKGQKRNEQGKDPFRTIWPMLHAKITRRDIWKFWLGGNADPKALTEELPQGFDLGLYPYEGNCDGCFLKGKEILKFQERERPGYMDWWIDTEANYRGSTDKPEMAQFNKAFSYLDLRRDVERQDLLLTLDWRNLEFDAECGVSGTDTRIRCGARRAT